MPMTTYDPAHSDPAAVLAELREREPLFHRMPAGTTRAQYAALVIADFWEVGASGARYELPFILDVLEQRQCDGAADIWSTDDFALREIAADNYLPTYTLTQGERVTRRATLWCRTEDGWKAVYHQGTVVAS